MLIDSHCHLDFDHFSDPGIAHYLDAAKAKQVAAMVTICTRIKKFDRIRAIAETYENVFCSVGTHPHYADQESDFSPDDIIALSQHPKCIAIGEAGLDYHHNNAPVEAQKKGFITHIQAARATALPLIIHTRSAEQDTANILTQEIKKGPFKFVLHCFSSESWLAELGIELGGLVSFSGIVTFNSAKSIQKTAQNMPLDKILVETDAPYLAPTPYRGQPNQPAFVHHTAQKLAQLRHADFDAFSAQTTQNFIHYFTKFDTTCLGNEKAPAL